MEELVYDLLKSTGRIGNDELIAENEVWINGNEVVIKGNRRGLILLADYLVQVAICEDSRHHVHLDANNFFDTANCEVVIAKE